MEALILAWVIGDGVKVSQAEARGIVAKAVQAQGGLDKLLAAQALRYRITGNFQTRDGVFQGEVHSQPGGKARLTLRFQGGDASSYALVLNGAKGWMKINGVTEDMDQEALASMQRSSHVDRVSGLTVLVKSRDYKLSLLGESKVNKTPALGVKVAFTGMPDVNLYFDKQSGLLLKAAHHSPDRFTKREVFKEMYFSDYRFINPAKEDEAILKKAGRAVAGSALMGYLRQGTPDAKVQARIQDLIRQLGDNSFARREKASSELVKLGIQAAALLRQARSVPDAEVVRRAEKCLARLGQGSDQGLVAPTVRLLALRKPAGGVQVLLDYLPWAADDNIVLEVQSALAALGKDGGTLADRPGRRLFLEGLRLPHTVTLYRDGRIDMECQSTHFEFFNRFDEALFLRP